MNNGPADYISGDLSLDNSFDLWVLLSRTYYAISRLRDLELLPVGISTAQAQILNTIQNAGGESTITQITKYTLRQHHSVSDLISKMSKQGLVKKSRTANSKEFKISLTSKGHNLYDTVSDKSVEMIFSSLPEKERQHLAENLIELNKIAREMLGIDHKPPYMSLSENE